MNFTINREVKQDMKKTLWSFGSVFLIFIIWIVASVVIDNAILLPSPLATFKAFASLFTTQSGLLAMAMTFTRLIVAIAIATVLGIGLGVASGLNAQTSHFLRPIVTLLRTVPVISIVVILLILFGFAITPYLLTFMMIFPIIYQAIADGIENIDKELIDVFKLEDESVWDGIKYCYLPLIERQIRTSFLQAAGLGIKVLVMAEYLAQTRNSVGNALYLAKVNLEYDKVFAWTLLLIILAVVIESIIRRFNNLKQPLSHEPNFSRE